MGYWYRWRSNWGERCRKGGDRSEVVIIVILSEGKEQTRIYIAGPLTSLRDVNVWKQYREEGRHLKPLMITTQSMQLMRGYNTMDNDIMNNVIMHNNIMEKDIMDNRPNG